MGLTKQYRRFAPSAVFGIVGSPKGGIWCSDNSGLVFVARAEDVVLWDLKKAEIVREFKVDETDTVKRSEVTQIEVRGASLAVGYHDGSIRLFDTETGDSEVTLNGHKSAVTSLALDESGHRLASGSRDAVVIVWDVVNECGLFRLKGHKGPITRCRFLPGGRNVLVSSARDSLIKFWDLDIQHCFSTLAGHLSEVWDFAIVKGGEYLVSGSGDSELRVWRLTFKEDSAENKSDLEPTMKKLKVGEDGESGKEEEEDGEEDESSLKIERLGSILRAGQDKVSRVGVDPGGRLLFCHGSDNTVELFAICGAEEVRRRCQKRARKERRKARAANSNEEAVDDVTVPEPTIQEEFRRVKVLRAGGKVRGVSVAVNSDTAALSVLTANNIVEQFRMDLEEKEPECSSIRRLEHPGHRSDVRTVCFSSDNTAVLSGSHESVKIWNRAGRVCIRTVSDDGSDGSRGIGYCLSSFFVAGDRQAVVGTKAGKILVVDVASAEVTEAIEAHAAGKEVWGLSPTHDGKGFASASADQTVKFWDFELLGGEGSDAHAPKRLSAVHRRTLKLEEDALAVNLSADGRLIAVALLDSTVKVFFADTLKFFLSLYGHKLPVTAMDVSADSQLIATGSADKNLKIWGLDFGDCHKSIFAHDEGITAVRFVPGTHLLFTASKDGKVKQWDADSFERILTLDGHHGEIWSLAVSPNGRFVATSGHDKSLRLWERTEEVLVLDDERETEREKEGDKQLATGDNARAIPGENSEGREAGMPARKTVESERGAERLMEAVELFEKCKEEERDAEEEAAATGRPVQAPQLPALMLAYRAKSPEDYVAKVIESIKSSEVEQTLLVLPFDYTMRLLRVMERLLGASKSVEVVCRMFFFLVEINYGPLGAGGGDAELLKRVRAAAHTGLSELRDCAGFNQAALRYHTDRMTEQERVLELMEASSRVREKRRKKGNKSKAVHTAIISL